MITLTIPLLFSLLALAAGPETSDRIQVTKLSGPQELAVVRGAGKTEKVRAGESLFVGDELRTAKGQLVELLAYDGSQWKIAPETNLKIESRKPQKQNFFYWTFQLIRGSLWGLVPKGESSEDLKLKVRTKNAALGIRGTEFLMAGQAELAELDVLAGTVWWGKDPNFAPGTYQEVKAGQHAETKADGTVTTFPSTGTTEQLVRKYRLLLASVGAEKPRSDNSTAEDCRTRGLGWESKDGSLRGRCVAK